MASKCTDTKERIIATCLKGSCSELFYVKDVGINQECRRRSVVIIPPAWAKTVIEYEVNLLGRSNTTAVFELIIQSHWLRPHQHNNLAQYIEGKEKDEYRPEIDTDLIIHPNDQYSSLKQQWDNKETEAYYELIRHNIFWWSELCIFVAALLFSSILLIKSIEHKRVILSVMTLVTFISAFVIAVILMEYKRSYSYTIIFFLPGLLAVNLLSLLVMFRHKYKVRK